MYSYTLLWAFYDRCCVVSTLYMHACRRAIVVAPKTLLAHWEKELRICGLASLTHHFYGSNQCERCAVLPLTCSPFPHRAIFLRV